MPILFVQKTMALESKPIVKFTGDLTSVALREYIYVTPPDQRCLELFLEK